MDILKKRWFYILNGFIILLFMGCSLAWSIFVVPIENAFAWTRNQTSLAFTINILFFSVGSIMTGILSKYLSFAWLGRIAAALLFTGFMGTSFVSEVWQLYITYGVIVGTGIGLGYNCIISACPMWLPEKTATATGMLLMGYALSTAIFGPLLNALISSVGIVNTFRTLAVVCGTGILIGSFNLKTPTLEETELLPKNNKGANKKDYNVITSEMIKKPIFWVYYVATSLMGGAGLVIVNHCSPMMIEGLAVTAAFAAIVVSITSISNGVSRLLWGIIFDKIGLKNCMYLIGGSFLLASIGMFFSFSSQVIPVFIVSACLMYFSFGGNAITCPAIIRELFGHRTFSLNYSIVATTSVFQSFFPSIAGMIQVSTKGYQTPLFLLCIICLFNLMTIILFTRLYQKQYLDKQRGCNE